MARTDARVIVCGHTHLPEIRDLRVEADGSVVAAALAAPPTDPRPPSVRIRLPEGGAAAAVVKDEMVELEDPERETLEGVIEGLPGLAAELDRSLRGRIVRIAPDGVVRELWRSSLEAPFALPPATGESGIFDPTTFDRLRAFDYRDKDVRDAALAFVSETGWTTYTPYSVEQQTSPTRTRLTTLCNLRQVIVEAR